MSMSREMAHFLALTRIEQEAAVKRMWAQGWSILALSAATRWSVEAVVAAIAKPGRECNVADRK
jgi:hypothetical protein